MRNVIGSTVAVLTLSMQFSINAYAADRPGAVAEQSLKTFASAMGTEKGAAALMRAHAAGLPATSENINAIRQALTKKLTNDETTSLIRILGTMAKPSLKSPEQSALMSDLKGFTNSGNREIARAATFATSRAGYSEDAKQILAKGRDSGVLSTDEYFGELSHMIRLAPKHAQQEILTSLASGRNAYSIDVLTSQLSDRESALSLYPEAQRFALKLLKENEPQFPMAIGRFGLIDGFRYVAWLRSYATLQNTLNQKSISETILHELNSPKTDPRKVLAFWSSAEGNQLMSEIGHRGPLEPSIARARAYSESFPGNQMVLEIANDIGKRSSMLRP